ncbi:hypothetical protein [Gracilinema caldarium]|uniref:Uncharacterized protein n=1 Tax=Gracilinema caldarium (strain ATCC 51460 / DSM 7334 / H1) TaxID=744872 RepID=F8EY94_GRAC1|nr:hypothetical protein [Gracilinema caldarium]AEJ18253.1 hypothetical protein Spica_0082 [Gracilinema caldarium DSM 7334]
MTPQQNQPRVIGIICGFISDPIPTTYHTVIFAYIEATGTLTIAANGAVKLLGSNVGIHIENGGRLANSSSTRFTSWGYGYQLNVAVFFNFNIFYLTYFDFII